jgi:hypothetical protein
VWGDAGLGVGLTTDADLYPTWVARDLVAVPVGTSFSWKFVAVQGGVVSRWESGSDREGRARPDAAGPNDDLVQLAEGDFRE